MTKRKIGLGFESMEERVVLSGVGLNYNIWHEALTCPDDSPSESSIEQSADLTAEQTDSGAQGVIDGTTNTFMVGERHY